MTANRNTWCGWPEEPPEDFMSLPLHQLRGEEGDARKYSARATGGRECTEHVPAGRRSGATRAAPSLSGRLPEMRQMNSGKEERRKTDGRRGGPGFGTGSTDFPGCSGGNEMVMTWDQVGEQRRLRPWRALLMLLVALAIFGAVCWLVCVERGN